ncbi:13303_t:CDS:2, partial [Racocetra fulgida]
IWFLKKILNFRGQKLDMQYFKRIEVKKNYNIDFNRHDKNGIKQKISAIKRSTNKQSKTNTSTKKRSVQTSKKSQRTIESNLDTNDLTSNTKSNNKLFMMPMKKLEYKECMLLIEERKEKLRELQIANTIKEHKHGLEQE